MTIRVLLVEDHRMVREALCDLLLKVPGIQVVGEAGDGREALELAKSAAADVIVLDISLPDINGIEVAERLRDAGNPARIVALSAFADKRFVTAMLRAGVSAYVTKSAAGTELLKAISSVAAGQGYFSPQIAAALASAIRERPLPGEAPALSRRESEVLRMIAEGRRSPAMAEELHVSVATIEVHRRNLMRKLGLRTIAELTKYAIREGIVPL